MFSKVLAAAYLGASACFFCASSASALEPAAIEAKLSTIVVLTPLDNAGQPIVLKGAGMVAAFSPFAAQQLQLRWKELTKASKDQQISRFAPLTLTQFEAIYLKARSSQKDLTKVYLPDPFQVMPASELLQQQGIDSKLAQKLAQGTVHIFCPDPLVRITSKAGAASRTEVPCGFDFTALALLANRTNALSKTPTVVKAYSLSEIVNFLTKESADDVKNLTILPVDGMPGVKNSFPAKSQRTPQAPQSK